MHGVWNDRKVADHEIYWMSTYPTAWPAPEIVSVDPGSCPTVEGVTITDLAGDGNHYAAEVIDESFRGMNRVQQQRAVYAALKGKMDGNHGELHALALTTKVPG